MLPLLAATLALGALDGGAVGDLDPGPDGGPPPPGLACLPSWYLGEPRFLADAGWGLQLPGGAFLPWRAEAVDGGPDGGDAPVTLEELYRSPYRAGPIVPVDTADAGPNDDPGRRRLEQLFRATYGGSREEVYRHLTYVPFFGVAWPFHQKVAPAVRRVVERLQVAARADARLLPFLTDIGGTWIWRPIARSRSLSTHAWGIAIDLNVDRSFYWRWTPWGQPMQWRNRTPQAIVDAFEAEGFIWGGRWRHFDTMHFEYRPELLAEACR